MSLCNLCLSSANLVEQLNLPNNKEFIADNELNNTPVFKYGWQFLSLDVFYWLHIYKTRVEGGWVFTKGLGRSL